MNSRDLIARVAARHGHTKKLVREMYKQIMEEVELALSTGEEVQLVNYINFIIREDPQRFVTDPRGGQKIVPRQNRLIIRPGTKLKKAVGQRVRIRSKYKDALPSRKGLKRNQSFADVGCTLRD